MANLAIKGHLTRGKEVIELLEMLGGKNKYNLTGTKEIWYILLNGIIKPSAYLNDDIRFSLEEFLKKYPYKVEDKVYVNSIDYQGIGIVNSMYWDSENDIIRYEIFSDKCNGYWRIEELQPYKEETMEGVYYNGEINCYHQDFGNKVRVRLGDEFEIKVEDGKTYVVRKNPQYPKTYVECAKILSCFGAAHIDGYKCELLEKFQELLIVRDAYWKIAGEQMGLGKPWKPDYTDESYEQGSPIKYVIYYTGTHIIKGQKCTPSYILSFPTEKMRDTFYENFKELIEDCKELL